MRLRFITAGESHGPALVAILDGMPAGLPLPIELIQQDLVRRQIGYGSGPRMKLEKDQVKILSGVMAGKTTGAPIAVFIENQDHKRWQGKPIAAFVTPRPGHADLTGAIKYGYTDIRPGLERASARETAVRVAVGAICRCLLSEFGIKVGGYISSIAEIKTNQEDLPYEKRFDIAETNEIRCSDISVLPSLVDRIKQAIETKDTLGGIVEIVAIGVPVGLGSFAQWDCRLDAKITSAIMSIPSVKGVEIGPAFENTCLPGTKLHDSIVPEGNVLLRSSNRAGGIEGGISNGQPIILHAALKPIASTLSPQKTVDLSTKINTETVYERSDFCHVPRAIPVLEAMVCFVLAQALLEKLGGDSIEEIRPRFSLLRKASFEDLPMDGSSITFWPDQD
jgi:chorismate synthase